MTAADDTSDPGAGPDAESAKAARSYTQGLQAVEAKLDEILALLHGATPVPAPPAPPPAPPKNIQAVYWMNQSKGDIGDADCQHFVTAMNIQAAHLVEIWPSVTPVAHVFWTGDPAKIPVTAWPMYFLRDADEAGALGYHSVDPHGRPYGRVFTRYQGKPWPALRPGPDGVSISNIASHEGGEIQGDPPCDLTITAPNADVWAAEVGDPVEAFSYDISCPDGTVVSMSNLVGGAFFGLPGKVDIMGVGKPFTISPGGYAIINDKQVFSDKPSLRFLSQQGSPAGRSARRLAGANISVRG